MERVEPIEDHVIRHVDDRGRMCKLKKRDFPPEPAS